MYSITKNLSTLTICIDWLLPLTNQIVLWVERGSCIRAKEGNKLIQGISFKNSADDQKKGKMVIV